MTPTEKEAIANLVVGLISLFVGFVCFLLGALWGFILISILYAVMMALLELVKRRELAHRHVVCDERDLQIQGQAKLVGYRGRSAALGFLVVAIVTLQVLRVPTSPLAVLAGFILALIAGETLRGAATLYFSRIQGLLNANHQSGS